MNKVLIFLFTILFCAHVSFAQDSFHNPLRFSYYIDCTTEYTDSILDQERTRIDVTFDKESKSSYCTLMLNGEIKFNGRILDRKLEAEHQLFLLEKYFNGKYNACLSITKGSDIDNQKVAMIYYANDKEDLADEKTCYCLFLTDVEKVTQIK